jgi:hypothetical protein
MERAPEDDQRPRTGRSNVSWLVGVLVLVILAYITLNTLREEGPGSRGLPQGEQLPPVAMPLGSGTLDGDANVARTPDEGEQGEAPACEVRGAQILNACELAERGPVVVVFLVTGGGETCIRQLDLVERVRGDFEGVQFAGVAIRGDRQGLRELIRERGWRFPVGYDRDGIVANVYGVAVCPTTTMALPGGRVVRSSVGLLEEPELRRSLQRLVEEARGGGWRPPAA